LLRFVVLVAVAVAAFSLPAQAVTSHTTNGVYHGCGDCSVLNNYFHPFTEYNSTGYKVAEGWYDDVTVVGSGTCFCAHAHVDIYTGQPECWYGSRTWSNDPALSAHFHYPDTRCT
jgi:hypothetical protein